KGRSRSHPEAVNRIRQQKNLDAACAEAFEMGRGFEAVDVVAHQMIDRGLVLFERRDIVFETSPCARRAGGLEAAQRKQRVAALEIAVDTLLQHGAEIVPNLGVGLGLLLRELVEIA